MTSRTSICLSCILGGVLMAATDVAAQSGGPLRARPVQTPAAPSTPMPSDPLAGPVVTGAPYSGDAVTTITQTLGDGTHIEERTEAQFYRDSAGRIRREETIIGLGPLNPAAQTQTLITIDPTPGDAFAYTLDPAARTARRGPRVVGPGLPRNTGGAVFVPDNTAADQLRRRTTVDQLYQNTGRAVRYTGTADSITLVDSRPVVESLGTRQMEGVRVTGRKITNTIPTGQIGNDRPIVITDERWESPDLKVLVYSRFSDPRTGVVEFKLTNINRVEPPANLFAVPGDYTTIPPGAGGGRGPVGGPGGRGGPQQ